MKWLRDQGRRPCSSDPRDILTLDLEINGIAKYFGGNPEPVLVQQWEESLEVELKSIQLFEDSLTVLQSLKARGLRLGLCSNLAKPYARAIDRLLPNVWDFRALSFELGIIKPESGMYTFCLQGLQLPSESVLFIGDSVINDYVAPRKQGMKSLLIDRNDKISKYQSISSLMQLLESL